MTLITDVFAFTGCFGFCNQRLNTCKSFSPCGSDRRTHLGTNYYDSEMELPQEEAYLKIGSSLVKSKTLKEHSLHQSLLLYIFSLSLNPFDTNGRRPG